MLIIAPSHASFAGVPIADVESIAIERASEQLIVEFTDASRDPAFADVARCRTTIKLTCLLRKGAAQAPIDPTPGTLGQLAFTTGPTELVTAPAAMVVGVTYQLGALPKGAAARRTIEFLLIAPAGAPVLTTSTIGGAS